MISKNKLERISITFGFSICDFGSMLDWISILGDEDGNMIIMNANPNSEYHQKFALVACDYHGRMGYYVLWENISIGDLIDKINNEINNEINNGTIKDNDSDGDFDGHREPIKMLMKKRNMPRYYG
jgi:hypothetical protein